MKEKNRKRNGKVTKIAKKSCKKNADFLHLQTIVSESGFQKLETVKNMTAMHFPIAAISGATGLSETEIKNLQSESKALF